LQRRMLQWAMARLLSPACMPVLLSPCLCRSHMGLQAGCWLLPPSLPVRHLAARRPPHL